MSELAYTKTSAFTCTHEEIGLNFSDTYPSGTGTMASVRGSFSEEPPPMQCPNEARRLEQHVNALHFFATRTAKLDSELGFHWTWDTEAPASLSPVDPTMQTGWWISMAFVSRHGRVGDPCWKTLPSLPLCQCMTRAGCPRTKECRLAGPTDMPKPKCHARCPYALLLCLYKAGASRAESGPNKLAVDYSSQLGRWTQPRPLPHGSIACYHTRICGNSASINPFRVDEIFAARSFVGEGGLGRSQSPVQCAL